MSTVRRTLALSIGLLLTAALTAAGPAASAGEGEDGFKYWNYSHLTGAEFVAAQTGPADHQPADGDVEGWRFGTSTVSQGIWPRADLDAVDFESVCAGTEAAEGEKRVAVLVDYGTTGDAQGDEVPEPRADCAVVPEDADGRAVLDAVTEVRVQDGLVCGLDGYPSTGCGDPVPDVTVPAEEDPVDFALPAGAADEADAAGDATEQESTEEDPAGLGWPVVVGILVVLALLAGLVTVFRRRSVSPRGPRG